MDGVSALKAIARLEFQTKHFSRPVPEPRQVQNQNQNQRRSANKGNNDDGPLNDGSTNRRPLFEPRARSTNRAYAFY